MRKDILIKRVKEEAKKLRKLATKEELKNLSFVFLNPCSAQNCIYGQMTGNCNSERALALIESSCDRVYDWVCQSKFKLNGSLNREIRSLRGYQYSAIEAFIILPENKELNNRILIEYLRGERKTLNFK